MQRTRTAVSRIRRILFLPFVDFFLWLNHTLKTGVFALYTPNFFLIIIFIRCRQFGNDRARRLRSREHKRELCECCHRIRVVDFIFCVHTHATTSLSLSKSLKQRYRHLDLFDVCAAHICVCCCKPTTNSSQQPATAHAYLFILYTGIL